MGVGEHQLLKFEGVRKFPFSVCLLCCLGEATEFTSRGPEILGGTGFYLTLGQGGLEFFYPWTGGGVEFFFMSGLGELLFLRHTFF